MPFTQANWPPAGAAEPLEEKVESHSRHELAPRIVVRDSSGSVPFATDETGKVESSVGTSAGMQAESVSVLVSPRQLPDAVAPALVAPETVDSRALAVQPAAEVVDVNPTGTADNAPVDTSADSAQESAGMIEAAPALVATSRIADTSAVPVETTAQEMAPSGRIACAKEETRPPSLLDFYGLSEQAFQATPDPAYLYLTQVHQEALTSLAQAIQDLRGFMALIAEPGMGKTTLLNKLMEDLRDSARTVFLFQTQCNSRELLRYLLGELGVKHAGLDAVAMHRALNEILFQEMLHGRRFVLIVDEAQNLDEPVLETIRLLSDFETSHRKLIQIVLAGQPQLVDRLMRPSLAQLRQRIAVVTSLEPLSVAETAGYVEHRLRAAGSSGEPIFTEEALVRVAELSQGTPRSINNLCFNALLSGHLQGERTIDSKIVERVAAKLDLNLLRRFEQHSAGAQRTRRVVPSTPSQFSSVVLTAPARGSQPPPPEFDATQSKTGVTLHGKLTEKRRSRSWGKENEFRIQVSLERGSSSDIPVADRYYCCSFYIGEEQAAVLRVGQPITIRIQ